MLQQSDWRGRKQRFSTAEQRLICCAAQKIHSNGSTVDRHCLVKLTNRLIDTLYMNQHKAIGFKTNRTGKY